MTDLLARLRSTSIVKSSLHPTPEKFEALEHLEAQTGRKVVMVRNKGEDLPKGWEQMWEMQEAGWVELTEQRNLQDPPRVEYHFSLTSKGYNTYLDLKGVAIPPPPPSSHEKKPRRRRGPAAKTGKPGL